MFRSRKPMRLATTLLGTRPSKTCFDTVMTIMPLIRISFSSPIEGIGPHPAA
ncbi:hypothetical protein C8J32_10779 [Rhizobium sp. PP-CC-3A-592]|nr:hypothetical protein C8J32_10779 [Rhizobium sp. PP-CC-3A-592]